MDRPFRHSRCDPGGTARATLDAQTPYWRNPSFPAPRTHSLHPYQLSTVAVSAEERVASGGIEEVIELCDERTPDDAQPHISIIIPVRNDAEALSRTLDDLDRLSGIEWAEVLVGAAGDRQDTSRAVECIGTTRLIHEPLHTSGRRFLARGPWRTFLFIIWLLLLHTLRFDTERYAARWRGPTHRPPGSPWPHRHQPRAGGTAREGDC